jgi:hypothetical protein
LGLTQSFFIFNYNNKKINMKSYIQKVAQKFADRIIVAMSKARNEDELNALFTIGMFLDQWALSKDIELN